MKKLVAAAMFVLFGALFACVSRADAVPPTTNDWFDVSFEALTPETAISVDSTTGISLGAGSWTAVPANGAATIVADEDAGGEATCLSLNAPGEELTLTPAAFGSPSDIETVSVQVKADAIDELPVLDGNVQGAFTVYLDENDELSAQGWTADGWKVLSSASAPVNGLTNSWVTVCLDFATKGGVRVVRYSVKPASGSLSVLSDANGDTWLTAATNATVVSSVSLSGIGSVRTINGDSLTIPGVATYNGVGYDTLDAAIAAAVADNWASGAVTLLADAAWFPTATGAYNIDVNGNTLTVKGASGSWSGTTYTVSKLYYIWTGGASGDWWVAANWTPSPSKWANGDTYMFTNDVSVLYNANTDRNNTYYYHYTYADNCEVTISSKAADGTYYKMVPNSMVAQNGAKWIFDNIFIAQRANALVMDSSFGFTTGSSNIVSTANADVTISCDLVGDFVIDAQGGKSFNVTGDISAFTGKFISNETKSNRGIVFGAGSSDTSMSGSSDASFTVNEGAFMYFNVANSVQFQIGELLGSGGICGDNRNASGESFRLYIGGKNTDFEANAAAIRVTASSKAMDVSKVGTGAMAYNLNGIRDLYVDAGSVVITNSSRLPSGNIAFCGGRVAGSATLPLVDISAKVKNSTAAIDLDVAGSVKFATALADSNVGGLVKRGNGTLTLSAAPAYSGTTTVAGGVLVVPQDTVISELSCAGGKLTVPLADNEADTPVLTIASLADGTTVEDLEEAVAVNGVAISVEAGEGGYIVKATRTAQTLTWTGAVDTNWTTPGNWSIGGVSTSLVPAESDTVVFPALAENAPAWQVALSSTPTVTNVTANGAVTLSGALIRTENVEGTATITLGDSAGFRTYDYYDAVMTISADIEANGSAEHPNEIRGYYTSKSGKPDQGGTSITFSGNLTGNGTLKIVGCRCSNALSGDCTAFSGHLWVVDDQVARNKTYLSSVNATSSNAVWTVYNDSSDGKFLRFAEQTAYFGALNGTVYQSTTWYNNIFEIGAANVDCAFGGKLGATKQNHITKVGSATLTFSGSDMGNLVVKDGVFAAAKEVSFPKTSITFSGEGGVFDPTTNTVDFAAKLVNSTTAPIGLLITNDLTIGEIPASNTAGLTKKGSATLTLSAVPKYTGVTTVEEGELVVPTDTVLDVCFAGGTLTGARYGAVSFADGYKFTAGVDARVVASGTADVSNLVIYIADPTADDVYRVLRASGGVSGEPTLAFPEDTSDELKARWTLKIGSKSVSVGTYDIGSRLILK